MPDHYDALETRDPAQRAREQAAALPAIIARAMSAPGWAKHLAGIDPKSVNSRSGLAKLPVLHKSDIAALQKENPPFGGLAVTAPGKVRRLLMSPGPIFEPEGQGVDWYGAARALFAAGFRAGDIVHNSFAYHLTPGGFILEFGLRRRSAARSFRAASAIPSSSSRRSRTTGPPAMSARRISSRFCSTPPRRPARTPPRSSARWYRARRCRPRCARNSKLAASPCCNAMPLRSSA